VLHVEKKVKKTHLAVVAHEHHAMARVHGRRAEVALFKTHDGTLLCARVRVCGVIGE
jgi:hypothetical protein